MRASRSTMHIILAIGLALLGVGSAPPVPPDDSQGPPDQTVTLITGDRVKLLPSGFAVQPGPGRSTMVFEQYRHGSHQYVIPVDALELVRSGRLDRRLFDVTMLLELGYGDANRADLPLIITSEPGARAAVAATGAQVTREILELGVTALQVSKQEAARFWVTVRGDAEEAPALPQGVLAIWLDGQRQLTLDLSVPQIGAPTAWQLGFTGAGVTVAVLDSGIDATHADFAGRIVEVRNFTEAADGNDEVGHGTHVASILTGTGAASDERFRGVAPDAHLLVGKVCPTRSCPESAILAGMAWAAEQGAAVVNLSLSGPDGPELDPLEAAVNQLTAETGTLFVASAGNNGTTRPVGSPASADAALAVGAVDRQDDLAEFSSRGPRVGDAAVKPDITAPGVGIVAARAADGTIGDPVDPNYTRVSGTSMAAPHAAGAAVLLAQQHPDWTAAELKAALMVSALPHPVYTAFEQGAGRLDVAAAVHQSVLTSPASLSLGRQPFPHDDDEPVSRMVTYRSFSSTPTVLSLAVDVSGPDGLPAPPGMFSVEPGSVTLAPFGEAEVTVTADTRVPSPLGHFTGALLAAAEDTTVRTALGIDKELELYDLTLTHIDRIGTLTGSYTTHVLGVDNPVSEIGFGGDATLTLRLPPGDYHAYSVIRTPAGERLDIAALAQPLVELTEDTSIVLDARVAEPMEVEVPRRSARSAAAIILYERRAPEGRSLGASVAGRSLEHMYTAHLGPAVSETDVIAGVHSQWGEPGREGELDFMDSPYAYHLAWFQRGRYWHGFERRVRLRDLAIVPAEYRTPMPGHFGMRFAGGVAPEGSVTAGFFFPFRLPFERTEYYVARDVRWVSELETRDPEIGLIESPETVHRRELTAYRPGGQRREVWNRAVFGPAFPPTESVSQWVYRSNAEGLPSGPTPAEPGTDQDGDMIFVSIPLFNDFSPDHSGSSRVDFGRTALYRNDQLIGETDRSGFGEFPVPEEFSSYRVEVEGARPSRAELSTEISATWTFTSGHDPDREFVILPVMAVRFGPQLDEHNSAQAGRAFLLPVWIQRQAGAPAASLSSLSVEVSYDDGATWSPVSIQGTGNRRHGLLHHPPDAEFVSLRAAAVDSAGASVRQTILRAYRLRPH